MSTPTSPPTRPRVTVPAITAMKAAGTPIAMITAYDATFARIVDEAGVDMILVGDSLGMVVQGEPHTIPVDIEEMEYHVRTVARAQTAALVVGDLPFGSYQVSPPQAVESSVRLMKAGAGCVKLEGGVTMAETIDAIARVDIPVVGHIGLTPQSYHRMGGHKVQGRRTGREAGGRDRLIEDAFAVEQAGAFALVIEGVPRRSPPRSPPSCRSRRSASEPGRTATARCSCCTTCWGSPTSSSSSRSSSASCAGGARRHHRRTSPTSASGAWPDDEHSFH